MSSPAILCAGRLYCDLIFTGVPNMPRLGEETFAQKLSSHAGGGAFITAATIRSLGWDVSMVAMLPQTPFDSVVKRDMTAAGISAQHCKPAHAGHSPQITVVTVLGGDRAFLTHNAGAALPEGSLPPGPWRHLHIGELRTLLDRPDLIPQARDSNMTVSVDCGWDETVVHKGSQVLELLANVDVFLPNQAEFEALTSSGLSEDAAPLTVIKRGREGASALSAGEWQHHPGNAVNAVDTTGAGDSFNGGFLVSWLNGEPLGKCLAIGNECGAASVAGIGGTSALVALRTCVAK